MRTAVLWADAGWSSRRKSDVVVGLKHGVVPMKRQSAYDDMTRAVETPEPYQTRLDPPLADPRVAPSNAESIS